MTSVTSRSDDTAAEPSSPPCALHEADPAYSGLDEGTLARARWRARRSLRRVRGSDERASAARRRRTVRLALL